MSISAEEGQDLSPREIEVVEIFLKEFGSNREIGQALGIRPNTVEFHWDNIRRKLGAKNRTHAVILFQGLKKIVAEQVESSM